MTDQPLKDAAYATPDPDRALRNIESFLDENPEMEGRLRANLRDVSMLFSNSQFLANYCISNPDVLFERLKTLDTPPDRDALLGSLKLKIDGAAQAPGRPSRPELDVYMGPVRRFRVEEVLSITLRDILGRADLVDTLSELTMLADVILDVSVGLIRGHMSEIYGIPADDAFSVIALGKMGAGELNFSSDIDLMYVYGEEGETSGVRSSQGVIRNRISSHEYYCKVGEAIGRFLSLNTEDGFAYRVDLRLRPEGQRGAIAQSLRGYEVYYESWGRAWERAMLIRARPVAGDQTLGRDFIEMIRPFVYRKYLDFSAIDEIKALKTRIDSQFKKGDIKRGYGGIREIEFFTQALQLIY